MKTGRYRLRRGLLGAILQAEYDSPTLLGGHVDASVRTRLWADVRFDDLSHVVFVEALSEPTTHREKLECTPT